VDVDAGLVRLRDALDPFGGELFLNVRHEPVPELPSNEPALQGQLAESHKEDHDPRTVPGPIPSA
jgi:hypothetical protein